MVYFNCSLIVTFTIISIIAIWALPVSSKMTPEQQDCFDLLTIYTEYKDDPSAYQFSNENVNGGSDDDLQTLIGDSSAYQFSNENVNDGSDDNLKALIDKIKVRERIFAGTCTTPEHRRSVLKKITVDLINFLSEAKNKSHSKPITKFCRSKLPRKGDGSYFLPIIGAEEHSTS